LDNLYESNELESESGWVESFVVKATETEVLCEVSGIGIAY